MATEKFYRCNQSKMFLIRYLLIVMCFSFPGMAKGNGGDLNRYRSDLMSVGHIIKNAETIRYPRDSIWRNLQKQVPLSEPFRCELLAEKVRWRSEVRPKSVHALRPGDIDVVGAMGDSLTAANGAREFSPMGVPIQDRGVSFTGGGLATWREFITLPNILKVFNPNLKGYSVGSGDYGSDNAQLNVAVPAALDGDALKQSKMFVSLMQHHPRVNFTSDWKLFSMYIGHNNLCSYSCYNEQKNSAENHKANLKRALDYLYETVPRLYVNLISVFDVTITTRVERTEFCKLVNRVACSCLFQTGDLKKGMFRMRKLVNKYQEAEKDLAFSQHYLQREDFTVEWQPLFLFMNGPRYPGDADNTKMLKYASENLLWTPDCFHFNQRGMSIWSIMLWNNMLEPVNNKSMEFREISPSDIKCPTKDAPFLFTKENSRNYLSFGHQ